MAMSVPMGTSSWPCRRVSTLSRRWRLDTGVTQSTSPRRCLHLRTHAGAAARKPSSSPCSRCLTHREDEFAAGDTSVGFGPSYRRHWEDKLAWYKSKGILPYNEGEGPRGTLI